MRKCSVQELARLELAHNNCIDMLLRFFTRRWELVRLMFGEERSNAPTLALILALTLALALALTR